MDPTRRFTIARKRKRTGLRALHRRGAVVYGPGDASPNGRFLVDILKHRVPGLLMNPAWFSYVHVDDVVDGLVLAGDRGHPGSVYVLSGENATVNDFAKRACSVAGVRAPVLRFPTLLAQMTGSILDVVARATGTRLPLTRETVVASSGYRWLHSHEPATREWGWRPRPLSAGLPETIAWVRSIR
jgi:dihydroflavonol-4-reductase